MVRVLVLSCVVCLLGTAGARAQPAGQAAAAQQSLLELLASKQAAIDCPSRDHCIFTGQVEMTLPGGQMRFFAERIEIFQDRNLLTASGNVVFANPEGRVAADRVEFDLKNNTGTFHIASGLMPLGPAADRRQFGNQDADVYFWGETIERLSDRRYRVTRGGFTTCVQPTPRWELVTGSLVLNLDDYALARNAVLRVKDVPLLYLPVIYYPIQQDDRATGFLLPTYGASTLRGPTLSNAFFWKLGRSQDATFFHDWFTRSGQGAGVEYRYVAAAQSLGNVRFYRLNQKEAEYTENGQTTTLPAGQSFEVTGTVNQLITQNIRARGRFDYFSDVVSQQLYHQNVYQASRNSRVLEGSLTAAFGPTSTAVLFQRNELLTSQSSNSYYVYGSTPRVTTTVAPRQLFGSPVYTSMNAEFAYLPDRSVVDGVVARDNSYHRLDLAPTVRVPLTGITFLSVNTSATYRATRYSNSVDPTGATVSDPYFRQYLSLRSEVVGPVLTRIWDRPDSTFAERLKHVIEPAFTLDLTSRITDYTRTPVVSDVSDFVVGGATRLTYGVTNRLLARQKPTGAGRGQAREFLTVGVQQTYYSNPESALYDTAYQSTYGYNRPLTLSPVALTTRVSPSGTLDGNLRLEYDVAGLGLQILSAGGTLNTRPASVTMNYSHRRSDGTDYLSAGTSMRWLDGRANGTYSLSWDIGRSYIVSQSIVGSYLAQCCGLQLEFQTFNYPEANGIPISSDTRFNFGFILAGLGTFSNFFGALAGVQR